MKANTPQKIRSSQEGYFLLEILITVVVLSLGLLGVAAMQYTGLRDNNRSNERSLATILAYDLIDRMRANRIGAQNGNYIVDDPNDPPDPPASGYDCITSFNGTTTTDQCSPTEMATADLVDWWTNALSVLPGGTARITCVDQDGATCTAGTEAPTMHTVTIIWDDARTGADGTDCDLTDPDDMLCMAIDVEL